MGNARQPGPLCKVRNPVNIADGTICRSLSPKPGALGAGDGGPTPDISDHLRPAFGGAKSGSMGEEAWFEDRYPNWMNHAKDTFIEDINFWVNGNWGNTQFKGPTPRMNVYARGPLRNDDKFKTQGDKPQNAAEADKVLGSFSIDVDTPVKINYSTITKSGRSFDLMNWETVMYVEDVLGLQKHDPIHTKFTGWVFPSRRVRRAAWKIQGEQMSYVVKAGDTLAKIALAAYGDAKLWKQIHNANRALIPDPDLIRPGQRLSIPKK